jgi:diguanylate cyclase (GGDEF)-like protein
MLTSKRCGHYGAAMFLDMDNFKSLNDTQGHDVGDLLLVEVANRISHCVREMDTVARLGGDEFVVVLRELSSDKAESRRQASSIAEKIRTALAQPYALTIHPGSNDPDSIEHHGSSSIGVALFNDDEPGVDDILRRAASMTRRPDSALGPC